MTTKTDLDPVSKWRHRYDLGSAKVVSVTPLSTVVRGKKVIATFVDTVIESAHGERMPRCMLLRGDSVIVIALLRISSTGQILTLMVEQLRPADGCNTLEFVGGMIEGDCTPRQAAVREVGEELGIDIAEDDLISLFPEPIRVCTAMMDERAHFFAFCREVDAELITLLEGSLQGEHADGEFIRVKVVDLQYAAQQPVFSAQVGVVYVQRLLESPTLRPSNPFPMLKLRK